MTSSRNIAYRVLTAQRERAVRASELIEREAADAPRDAVRFASEVVFSIIRRRATIDAIIAAHVNRPPEQVERDLWTLLQIGACQLVLMETPSHAAVHETVETARSCGNPRWTGFLNGTLRSIARTAENTDRVDTPAANHVPLSRGSFRQLDKPLLPDPEQQFADYIATAYSYPRWMVDRWLTRFDQQEVIRRADWFNTVPRLTLRVNPAQTTRESYLERLANADIGAVAGEQPHSIRMDKRMPVATLPGFDEGAFAVQDESAMAAATLLDPQPGEQILDLCCGSGTKSCHLGSLMQNTGSILAIDNSSGRLIRLRQNAERLGLTSISSLLIDVQENEDVGTDFDAALVDVPCSNSGVLGKRPEVRWRLQPSEFPELIRLQMRFLEVAAAAVKPGGRIVYSTCSSEPEENEMLVQSFLKLHENFTLASERNHKPGFPGDGAYQALLVRAER